MLHVFDLFLSKLEHVSVDPMFTTSIKDRCADLALHSLLTMQRENLMDSLHGCLTFEAYVEQFKREMTDCIELDQAIWFLLQSSKLARDCFYATRETGRCDEI